MDTPHEPRLARVAAMIADPARSRMLAYLLSGHAASAGELAQAACVTAPTASGHLAKLQASGFVVCEARGRHRYFKLADADIAHALEALALVAERGTHDRNWAAPERQRLRYARCCYGHLAGTLGVALLDSLLQHCRLRLDDNGCALTPEGERWLAAIGLPPPPATARQRWAYPCLDWSERRDHLAGTLASHLLDHFVERGWLLRPGSGKADTVRGGSRALALTPLGQRELLPALQGPRAMAGAG